MKLLLILALAFPAFALQEADTAAFAKIKSERTADGKKKLAAAFEKNFPKSKHLPEVYIEVSRTLVSQGDYGLARQYGEKAVATVDKMRTLPVPIENSEASWRAWLDTMGSSAKSNLDWVNQMVAWQQKQVRSTVLGHK